MIDSYGKGFTVRECEAILHIEIRHIRGVILHHRGHIVGRTGVPLQIGYHDVCSIVLTPISYSHASYMALVQMLYIPYYQYIF